MVCLVLGGFGDVVFATVFRMMFGRWVGWGALSLSPLPTGGLEYTWRWSGHPDGWVDCGIVVWLFSLGLSLRVIPERGRRWGDGMGRRVDGWTGMEHARLVGRRGSLETILNGLWAHGYLEQCVWYVLL